MGGYLTIGDNVWGWWNHSVTWPSHDCHM